MTNFQEYPKMVFHGTTGEQLICDCEEDIPEGYVSAQDRGQKAPEPDTSGEEEDVHADCATDADLEAAYDKGYAAGLAAKQQQKKPVKKPKPEPEPIAKKPAETETKDPVNITLKDMGLTRKEAKHMLKEEGVKFKGNATNDTLALKVKDLLENDKSK